MNNYIDDHVVKLLDPDYIGKNEIVEYHCRIKFKRGSCPKAHGGNCMQCLPGLHAVTSLYVDRKDNPKAYLSKMLSELAFGKLSYWSNEPKHNPQPFHRYIDPLEKPEELLEHQT